MVKNICVLVLFAFWTLCPLDTSHVNVQGETGPTEGLPQKGPYLSCVTQNSIIVSWRTETADSSVVQYGLTAGYGSEEKDATLKISHSLTLTGLLPEDYLALPTPLPRGRDSGLYIQNCCAL